MLIYVHHTLVDTPLNLTIGSISYFIREFFNLKLGASRCLVLSLLPPWSSCDGGGGGGSKKLPV